MLYQQAGPGAGQAGAGAGPQPDGSAHGGPQSGKAKPGEDVIDAEYEVKE